jgi:hypothetical protein
MNKIPTRNQIKKRLNIKQIKNTKLETNKQSTNVLQLTIFSIET